MKKDRIVPTIIYPDWEDMCKALPEKQRANLLLAIFAYMKRNEEPGEDDPILKVAWSVMRPVIDRDRKKFLELSDKRRDAVNQRWDKWREEQERQAEQDAENDQSDKPAGYEKFNFDFVADDFKEAFFEWLGHMKGIRRKYRTQDSINKAYKRLLELSNNNASKAKKVVSQAIANNWAGLHEVRESKSTIPNVSSTGGVKDYGSWERSQHKEKDVNAIF